MERSNFDKKSLRKFGMTMGIAFMVITALILLRSKFIMMPTLAISVLSFILAIIRPNMLKPVYILWTKLALVLSWINTRLILTVIFYLLFTPMGLVMKVFGVDLLDRKIGKGSDSYWKKKEEKRFNPLDYERQF